MVGWVIGLSPINEQKQLYVSILSNNHMIHYYPCQFKSLLKLINQNDQHYKKKTLTSVCQKPMTLA